MKKNLANANSSKDRAACGSERGGDHFDISRLTKLDGQDDVKGWAIPPRPTPPPPPTPPPIEKKK